MEYELAFSLLVLIALEVILGIDNIIFISIFSSKLPANQQRKARLYGLILAGVLRIGLLFAISLVIKLEKDFFTILNHGFSGKELILIGGGLFLLYKSSKEIYHKMEGESGDISKEIKVSSFAHVIAQILIMDIIFSIDSIITAIGIGEELWVMYVAVIVTVIIMLASAERISNFVNKHPAFKMLALSFLLLIGFALVSEGFGVEIPKGYIYFSMIFCLFVDILQMRMNKGNKVKPVVTHEHYEENENKLVKDVI